MIQAQPHLRGGVAVDRSQPESVSPKTTAAAPSADDQDNME